MTATPAPARNSTAHWREVDTRHHLHPFTDYKALAEEGGARIFTRAEGVHLTDSEGQRLLDGMAGLWCVNLGYGRRELAQAAYDQMLELPYYNTFFKSATPSSIELAERLAERTPEGLDHVFYGSSGSEANDTIVRMVRHFWNLEGRPEKKVIISREYAYHGSTLAGASLGGMTPMHGQGDLPLPGFVHATPPYWYDYGGELDPESFGVEAARAIEEKILELGPEKVAAFIGEPIQGAGGVIIPPQSYWPEVQRICRKYDLLLIVDEVISGFGRTGHWFASEHFGIEPDFMTLAKGITSGYVPLSAVMVGRRVAGTLIDKGEEFFHGYTYSGHPVACRVALENLRLIEEEGVIARVREETGPYFAAGLARFADHPLVGEVRALGLIAGLELVADKATRRHFEPLGEIGLLCRDHAIASGVVVRAVRDVMVMAPPLVITKAQIDELLGALARALDLTAADVKRRYAGA
jgi:putrescine aminotransferase